MFDSLRLLRSFGYFILAFAAFSLLASVDVVEKKLGGWFINSSTSFFEWSLPKANINIEHDRNPQLYDAGEVWISPISKVKLEEAIRDARMQGRALEIENDASLLFKVGTFPVMSLIFLLSLVLATPMIWKKKAKALFFSLLAFMFYFYFFIYFTILNHISISKIGVYELDGFSFDTVNFMNKTFCNFGFSLSACLLIWAATSIDFNAFFKQFNMAVQGGTENLKKTKSKRKKNSSGRKKKSK